MTTTEYEKTKELFVKCEYCFYYNIRVDPLVFKSVCSNCKMYNIEVKLKYAKDTKFEPNEKWLNAVRTLINKK